MALISKASLLMVPSTYEPGTLYNVLPSGNRAPDSTDQNSGYDQTRADFDFDRGSNAAATRIGSDGLIEKYRENLLVQSNQFDTTWGKVNISTTNGQEGYDGTNNAWKIEGTGSAAFSYLLQSESNNIVKTRSVYAKAGSVSYLGIWGSGSNFGYFDLSNGTLDNISGSSAITHSITDVGNGWYRCEFATTGSTSSFYIVASANANGTSLSTGDYIFIQDSQLESGLIATDYLDSTSVTGKAGVLVDLPRINYDANGENGSLLLEPSRANLIPHSEWFGSGEWINQSTDTTLSLVSSGSPDGGAFYRCTSGANGGGRIVDVFSGSLTGGVFSLYAKGSGSLRLDLFINGGGNVIKNITLTPEWTRYDVYNPQTNSSGDVSIRFFANSVADIYGAQLESGSYSTSYIPNHGESGGVTRAADSCSVTGASDVIGQTEGTLFAEIDSSQFLTGSYIGISDGGTSNRQIFGWEAQSGDSGTLRLYGFWNFSYSSFSKGQKIKVALAYKNNDFALYVNGTQAGTNTGATISGTLSQFAFNSGADAQNYQGNVYQTALFNERLTNAELATLTTL